MSARPDFPNDETGSMLRRLYEQGDDLKQPRIIDFCFIFPARKQALAFAEVIDDRDIEISISYYGQKWQVKVKRHMIPTHRKIAELEATFTAHAKNAGGKAAGWECATIKKIKIL